MTARQRDFGVVRTADLRAKGTRTGGRDDVVVQREDIKDGGHDGLNVDLTAGQDEAAVYETVLLIKFFEPLLRRLSRMVRTVREPLLHPQEIHEFGFVVDDVDE